MNKKIASQNIEDKKQALAEYLNQDINKIEEVYDNCFEVGNQEYMVLTDSEATSAAIESVQNVIDDCGVNCIIGWEKFIDGRKFKGYIYKDQKNYCANIADENDDTYGNRLIQECVEEEIINDDDFATIIDENGNEQIDYNNCLIDKNDLIEQYAVYLYQQNIKQPLEYMLSIYTAKELLEYFPNCIDLKRLIKYVIDVDGRGHCISSYDGKEIKYNDYFIYRTN